LVVEPTVVSPFSAWENFYVIVGSSAAALTGLQFVVVVLGAEARSIRGADTVGAFGTPTIVHLCAALLISAIMSVPWRALSNAQLALSASGVAGAVYMAVVIRRARRAQSYTPVLEDWLWHCIFPLIAYLTILVAALFLQRDLPRWLLVIGVTALVLLFIGIHNAWDAVTYIATQQPQHEEGVADRKKGRSS
jgi:phosphate starvation-inducible membrane PsiE